MPEPVLRKSDSVENSDANVEDNSDESHSEPDTDPIFGHWRNLDPFSKPAVHGLENDDTKPESGTMLAAELPWHAPPRSALDDTDTDTDTDLDIDAVFANGRLAGDLRRSRPSLLLLSPKTSYRDLEGRIISRRDSGQHHRLSHKWVNGVRYYMADADHGVVKGKGEGEGKPAAVRAAPPLKVKFFLGGDGEGTDEDSVGSLM